MPRKQRPSDADFELNRVAGQKVKYAPQGAAKEIFTMWDDEILMAGPSGTGKSLAELQKLHLVLSKYPGAKGFMSRKTRSSMTNSCIETFDKHVLKPIDRVQFMHKDQRYNYPNGSLCAVFGLDEPSRIMSTDFDIGYVQEATECSENDWEMLTTRLRNWVVPYQQLIGDCNPDKPSHWLKKRCDKGLTVMLRSEHQDNPRLYHPQTGEITQEGRVYLAKLDRLTGHRKARLRHGLWVAAEGVVYEDWNPEIHVISSADLPPEWVTWTHYWSMDWGFQHPIVWQDWVENPVTHQLIMVREIYHTKILVEDLARWVVELTRGIYYPRAVICDHDAEDRATFERHMTLGSGVPYMTLAAYKPISLGVQAVQKRLKPDWCDRGPGLLYCRDALVTMDRALKEDGLPTSTIEEYDGYVWDEKVNRLVNSKKDELPIDKDNHGMDGTRYQVAFHDDLAVDLQEIEEIVTFGDEITISPY